MESGAFDTRATLQRPDLQRTPTGAAVPAWTDVVALWVSVAPLTGREAVMLAASQVTGVMTVRITMPRSPSVDAMQVDWRIVADGLLYDIVSIARPGRKPDECEVMAQTGAKT